MEMESHVGHEIGEEGLKSTEWGEGVVGVDGAGGRVSVALDGGTGNETGEGVWPGSDGVGAFSCPESVGGTVPCEDGGLEVIGGEAVGRGVTGCNAGCTGDGVGSSGKEDGVGSSCTGLDC